MKKVFEAIGILSLLLFSFVFTEKTAYVAINQDDIMKQIENVKENYLVKINEPIITENTFIPGKCGLEIDVNASYRKLKKIGVFNENLLEFKTICPKETIKKNKDKFIIGGNNEEKNVSLLFIVKETNNLDTILKILNDNDTNANIFVDGIIFENNNEIINVVAKNHIIGNLSYNGDYNNPSFIWMTTVINKFNDNYCYTETLDENILKICSKNNSYTIVPNIVVKKNPTLTINKHLSNGSIISLYINDEVINELGLIIKHVKSKGYSIVTLPNLLKEN